MLKYPSDLNEGVSDSITFAHSPYRPNNSGGTAVPADMSGGGMIRLYVPNSTPAMNQANSWDRRDFQGELGKLRMDIIREGAGAINKLGAEGFEETIESLKTSAGKLSASALDKAGGAAKQLATEMGANLLGVTGNQALAISSGQVYNPNVELLYNSPTLRGFDFEFNFIPKNSSESRIIDDIIFEFKKWSAPEDPGGNEGVYIIPHVWKVSYSGMGSKKMAKFKMAALTDVSVVENKNSNTHTTFDDGTPVVTSVRLSFKEVDVVTRNDHEDARSEGYTRGY